MISPKFTMLVNTIIILKTIIMYMYIHNVCYTMVFEEPGAYEPPEGRKERPTAWNGI